MTLHTMNLNVFVKHFSQYQHSIMKINNKTLFKHHGEDVMNVSTEIAEEKTDKDT